MCIKHGVSISSNYTNTDFNLKLFKNGNKHKRMIIKELFEGPVGDYCIARNTIKKQTTCTRACFNDYHRNYRRWSNKLLKVP